MHAEIGRGKWAKG